MSSLPITIVVPHSENESLFLMQAVQAALQAYRRNPRGTSQTNVNQGIASVKNVAPSWTHSTADATALENQ